MNSSGDLLLGGIKDAVFLPTFVKNSLKALAIDEQLVSSIFPVDSILDGKLELPFLSEVFL